MLDQDKREELADIYSQIQQGNRKWRIRQIIAGQIGLLSRLFLEETIVKIIIPISFQLCKDEVASVRETACLQVAALLANNHTKALCQLLITENVKSFATYNRFTLRQAFICMCEGLLDDYPYFKANFLEAFQKLVDDKVINVRISLAKVLVRHFDRKTPASKEEEIIKIYRQLAKDKAADVVKILKKEHTIIDEVLSCSSEDHSRSQTYSEDNQSEERKHENDVMLEKVEQVKKEDAAHPHPQEKDDSKSPLLESEKEHILAKDAQIAIEKIVETKQVDEETPEVKEAIEEAEEINKKSNTSHEAKHEEKIDEVKVDDAAKDEVQREDVVVAPAEQEKSENQVTEDNKDDETVATEPDIEHKEHTTIVSDATNDKKEEEDKSATDKPEGEPTKADE